MQKFTELHEMLEAILSFVSNNEFSNTQQVEHLLSAYCGTDFYKHTKFIPNQYTRTSLYWEPQLEIVLISWSPNSKTTIHGHKDGGCLFKICCGQLQELRFYPSNHDRVLKSTICREGAVSYIDNDLAFHQVMNPYPLPAVSLHIYSEGIILPTDILVSPTSSLVLVA